VDVQVKHCQRCGKDHALYFQELNNAVDAWSYFAICPNTDQPILLRVETYYKEVK
jgi:transcription elongation factor Elf1